MRFPEMLSQPVEQTSRVTGTVFPTVAYENIGHDILFLFFYKLFQDVKRFGRLEKDWFCDAPWR